MVVVELIRIGDHCTIAPGVSFSTHDGGVWIFTDKTPDIQRFGTIDIKNNCFIGMGAILLPGIIIGPNSIVGAGAIVTKDVPPDTIVAGNPAKVISSIENYRTKVFSIWKNQRPEGYLKDLKEDTIYPCETIHKAKLRDYSILKKHLISYFKER
jgi:carbonic anhydrase/acetyltransferase-like protein (isoleucine patch superfamily)